MADIRKITLRQGHGAASTIVLRALPIADAVTTTIVLYGLHTTPSTIIFRNPLTIPEGEGGGEATGTGVFLAQSATMAGNGLSASSGTGIFLAGVATVSGIGLSDSSGEGLLVCLSSNMASVGISASTGSGAFLVNFSSISGAGISASSGTGVLVVAGDSGMNGVGTVSGSGSESNGQDSRKVLFDWDGIKHRGS